jgi:hypothetical protein
VETKQKHMSTKTISVKTKWVATDGWRGYVEPINAIGGCNHTGSWSDSPCPTHIVKKEIDGFKSILRKNKIRFKQLVTQSSNVFCQHVYILVHPDDKIRGLELSQEYQNQSGIRLFYSCS